ncbi:MAG TPA: hypothetical protein VGO46_04810 [Gemmatimonadaceae bacterium]|nr:hypothetical protein [Gemmatimonadaceae bacterium]
MTRPIETAVECRHELIALSANFQDPGWKFKIESTFPRWRDRTDQRLAASVSQKASKDFSRLVRKPRSVHNESWTDIVALHLAFLEELVHDVQIHPDEYGPSVIAHERRVETAAREATKTTPNKGQPVRREEITLGWRIRHPSYTVIAVYIVSVLAAFVIGVRMAHVPAIARFVGPMKGVVADTAKRPPSAPR